MGLTIDSLKRAYPKTTEALGKLDALVDSTVMTPAERQALKAQARMLALITASETLSLIP